MRRLLKTLPVFLLIFVLIVFCGTAVNVLIPKRFDYGATWGMYEKEEKNSVDVLFFGSSMVYCDVVPSVIWEESGYTSYVMGGPSQSIPMTYHYLKQACATQSPRLIFIEASGMFFPEHDASTKINITYMPHGLERLRATFTEAADYERFGLLFPLYTYHSRWSELKEEDYRVGLLGYEKDMLAGYTFLSITREMDSAALRDTQGTEADYERSIEYVRKIRDFCGEKGITPVFYLAPTYSRLSDGQKEKLESDFGELNLSFVDFDERFEEMGLSGETDFFDEKHLNSKGAKKFSAYLANYISDTALFEPLNRNVEDWEARVKHFNGMNGEV